ncbi:hypothetical protein DFH08DRAFT_1009745 [Mycena albidolilacea]|uniref:Heme haloperoxidase family profile domain-containing protein n=1 Tax=Mycena albidolilacea TaxID=1033008 RepID=A0AAD6ZYC5_9AGAR|nr:hypothetical protein DFH08DRAFT_1009745 [Mycena albidolilacea]
MRSFIVLLLIFPAALSARLPVFNGPSSTTEIQDGQTGTLIVLPPQATETGLKQIPGPSNQRGPAMNTLVNHGYIPRNGIASFEQIVLAMMEVWACSFQSRFDCGCRHGRHQYGAQSEKIVLKPMTYCELMQCQLARGNPSTNQVSIGRVSPLVPPLPGGIDGPSVGSIAKHGRFEGDASITRADAFIGDNRDFQDILYDLALLQLGKFGDNGPDGENTVFNIPTLIGIKKQNIMMDQARKSKGTTKQPEATLPNIGSFFRNQTFPANGFHASGPVTGAMIGAAIAQIASAILIPPGRNDAQGVYVADPPPPASWNSSAACTGYYSQAANTPGRLVNTTGIFKQNVDLPTGIQFQIASANPACNQQILPFGPAGV